MTLSVTIHHYIPPFQKSRALRRAAGHRTAISISPRYRHVYQTLEEHSSSVKALLSPLTFGKEGLRSSSSKERCSGRRSAAATPVTSFSTRRRRSLSPTPKLSLQYCCYCCCGTGFQLECCTNSYESPARSLLKVAVGGFRGFIFIRRRVSSGFRGHRPTRSMFLFSRAQTEQLVSLHEESARSRSVL